MSYYGRVAADLEYAGVVDASCLRRSTTEPRFLGLVSFFGTFFFGGCSVHAHAAGLVHPADHIRIRTGWMKRYNQAGIGHDGLYSMILYSACSS